jgi:hypothetical protein
MDWQWVGPMAAKLDKAFKEEKWTVLAGFMVEIMGRFSQIKVSDRHRMGEPWSGAYAEYLLGQ